VPTTDQWLAPERRVFIKSLIVLACASLGLFIALKVLDRHFGRAPRFGMFLDPVHGIWLRYPSPYEQNNARDFYKLKGLQGPVQIQVDSDQIKHVFAANDADLYFAEGWIHASERLWQMEFVTRVAAGRLSEIFGRSGLAYDKLFLKLGIPEAAKQTAELLLEDPSTALALRAYTQGVNAYINSLDGAHFPFEYKLVDLKPEQWSPLKTALLLKFMAFNLSGFSFDLQLSRSRSRLNQAQFDELFPLLLPAPEPIVPKNTKWTFATQGVTQTPKKPETEFTPDLRELEPLPQPNPSNGSNNWAVMAKRSKTGYPILSNDIHLSFSLPALWYEIQLVSPVQNVYGASLPGSPGVILGFNSHLAWAVTNGDSDVLDWFQLRYRDEKKSEYLYDGVWRPVISREVQVTVRGEKPESLILRTTHFGPVVYDETEVPFLSHIPRGLAMRWVALEPSNELKTFLDLDHARSTSECRQAIESYNNPDQNFLCADDGGDVGLWHMGKYPIRWQGQGRMLSDGSSSAWDWKGWVPRDQVPFVRNPPQGFVVSANQAPTDQTYPHYLGWWFEQPFRALRINEMLRSKDKFTPEDLIAMQADTVSLPARAAVTALVKAVEESGPLTADEKAALTFLKNWDDNYSENSVATTIFDTWIDKIMAQTWTPYFPNKKEYLFPPQSFLLKIIVNEPDSKWFDNPLTEQKETLKDVARATFKGALGEISHQLGSDMRQWGWAHYRPTQFAHISHISGLGDTDFEAGGGRFTVFANQSDHGPVWKLVVALGPKPRAWAVYPGGQSGDPTSRYYDNFLQAWRKNQLKEVTFMTSETDSNPRLVQRLRLDPQTKSGAEL